MRKPRLKAALAALAAAVAATAALLLIRERTRPAPPPPAKAAKASRKPPLTSEEARRQAREAVAARLADTNYVVQLKDLDARQRALAGESAALGAEIEAWQRRLEQEQPEFAAGVARLKELQQRQAQGEDTAAAIAEQNGILQAAMAKDPRAQELQSRQQELQARVEALAREARESIGARMRQPAGASAPPGGGR